MSLWPTRPSQAGRRCGFTLGEEKTGCGLDHERTAAAGSSEEGGLRWVPLGQPPVPPGT